MTTISAVKYTLIKSGEARIGDDSNNDSNAVNGSINPEISFQDFVQINDVSCKVTTVGYKAFRQCKKITSIHIHKYIISLKNYCFDWCSNCQSVTFDKDSQLQTIGASAFYNNSFTSILIPKSVKIFSGGCLGYNFRLVCLIYFGKTIIDTNNSDMFNTGIKPKYVYVLPWYKSNTFYGINVIKIPGIAIVTKASTRSLIPSYINFIILMLS